MKLNKNNNIQILFINLSLTILIICFAIDKCEAHGRKESSPKIKTKTPSHHAHHAHHPKASHKEKKIPFPPSEAPQAQAPQAQGPSLSEDSSGRSSPAFSAAFSDILKGDLSHGDKSDTKHNKNNQNGKNSALQKICSRTHYPDVCLASIPPLLNHKTKIEVVSVLGASIKACSSQVKLTISKVEKHASKSPELANALGDCKEKYHGALKDLRKAIHVIASRDFGKVTVLLSGVMADVSTCESKFEDLKPSSAKSKNHGLVSIMVNNCLSITSMIQH